MRRQQRRRYALHSLRTSECSSVSSADSRRCRRRAVCRRTDERPAAGHMIRDPPSRCALPRTPAAIRSERSLEQTDLTTAKYYSISAAELQTPTPGGTQRRHRLRSAAITDFIVPQQEKKLGETAFSVSGPTIWNSLPESLRTVQLLSVN